jgi:hypothetical protein
MKYLIALYKAMIKNREQQAIAYRQGHRYYY